MTFSRLASVLSRDSTSREMFTTVYPAADQKEKANDAISEEIRQSIALLIDRVDKLEASGINQGERLTNISQVIEKKSMNAKDIWGQLQRKLSSLEERFNDKDTDRSTQSNEIKNIQLEFNNLRELYAQLKSCCDKNAISLTNSNLEKKVQQLITGYFGTGIAKKEINKIVENLIMASNNVANKKDSPELSDENCEPSRDVASLSEEQVQQIVKELLKIYDADKTGRVDYALESAGGQIISIRCTQRYNVNTRAFKVLGFTLFYESGDPRTVIQGHTLQPGVCWAFQDFPGYLLIKLRSSIRVTGFTMEHAPRSILPNNEMKSAPRKFNVWGLKEENDLEPVLFGEYEFLDNNESLQYFSVENNDIKGIYEFIELRIHSNHGQLEYTCLYRFRVHGVPG